MTAKNLPYYKDVKSFHDFINQNLSKIYTYEDENKNLTYFYFFRRQKSQYYSKNELRLCCNERDKNEAELKKEFQELQKK